MKLFLLRHGIAVDLGTQGFERDNERPLTPEGRRKTRLIGRALAKLEIFPEVILTSPLVRAHQTAEIVATTLRARKRIQLRAELASGGDPKRLVAGINKHHGKAASIMLVGHEPDLSLLASLLLTGSLTGAALELKKGGMCALEIGSLRAGKCATLLWLAPPKLLL
jgi:phosphohistidine phosphatase